MSDRASRAIAGRRYPRRYARGLSSCKQYAQRLVDQEDEKRPIDVLEDELEKAFAELEDSENLSWLLR